MKDFLIKILLLIIINALSLFVLSLSNRIICLEDIVADMNEQIIYIEKQIGD